LLYTYICWCIYHAFKFHYALFISASNQLFFFSSRRRHTRSTRDWSSDVCSSDLAGLCARHRASRCARAGRHRHNGAAPGGGRPRSEERRVGKECRSRGLPEHLKKKKKKGSKILNREEEIDKERKRARHTTQTRHG